MSAMYNNKYQKEINEFEPIDEKDDDDVKIDEFDPSEVDISGEQQSINFLLTKMQYDTNEEEELFPKGIIDLNTEFQRSSDLWSDEQMSRLIESILIRFPLPSFYFDASDRHKWQVIDGLQRLSALKKFIVDGKLRLKNLEFLKKYEGYSFSELPNGLQNAIKNAQVFMYILRPGTPKIVKYKIFQRVNTGGLLLNAQEIRHAVNQGLPATFLKELANLPEFLNLINIPTRRMQDRELCLRFIAFSGEGYKKYKKPLQFFLNNAMQQLSEKKESELNQLKSDFKRALLYAQQILGDRAFGSNIFGTSGKNLLNKTLFEVWMVHLSNITAKDFEILLLNKDKLLNQYKELLAPLSDFSASITVRTTDDSAFKLRFNEIEKIIKNSINQPLD